MQLSLSLSNQLMTQPTTLNFNSLTSESTTPQTSNLAPQPIKLSY